MLRGSVWEENCILNSIPLCLLWTPHCNILATNPVALPHSRGMRKPQLFCCQAQTRLIKVWDCQYPGSIVWISQLTQCQHDVPLKALVVKSNFSWIANADSFIYCQGPLPVPIVAFSHYAATSNYHCKWEGDYDGYQRLFYLKVGH